MTPTPTDRGLRVVFDPHQFRLSPGEEQWLRDGLDGLARQVENFPVADLHVLLEGHARSNDVGVKLTLVLCGTTLVATGRDATPSPAFDHSLSSLLESLHAYKERRGQVEERQKVEKGTHQELRPAGPVDAAAIDAAIDMGDYSVFRSATFPYDDGVRKLVGRWLHRYPEVEARIGRSLQIDDLVEDVFLMAFEGYDGRPSDVPLGVWLHGLIDPVVKAMRDRPDEEIENVRLARSARAAGL